VDARARAIAVLKLVRISNPEKRVDDYPHKLSGGMRQRAMIAMALACGPQLLIADEPTTALDVTIQAQILDLLQDLQAETGMAIILITHDLGVVAQIADDVAVMYAGRIVEHAPVAEIFADAQHPYTIGLMGSMPRLEADVDRLVAVWGKVPPLFSRPSGCPFNSRCPFTQAGGESQQPALAEIGAAHTVACLRAPLEAHL
jgi:peptide/nickel transport system ATP-binding protein